MSSSADRPLSTFRSAFTARSVREETTALWLLAWPILVGQLANVGMSVADVATADVAGIGATLESHASFARRVNVGFRQVLSRSHILLRVFERGVGETQACGTGACAAMAAGRRDGLLDDTVRVSLPGGDLTVRWPGPGESLWLEGPALVSFHGQIDL